MYTNTRSDLVEQGPVDTGQHVAESSPNSEQENVQFSDAVADTDMSLASYSDPYRNVPDVSLQNFLSRPIQIASYSWGQNVNFIEDFDPWSLFILNPRVANRLNNYKMFSGKLHVKAVVNGNSFFYGLAGLHYVPMYTDDITSSDSVSKPIFNNANVSSAYLVMASQFPKIFINPTTSQGGTLELPFIYDRNMCDLTSGELGLLGQCLLRSYNVLDHANGATDSVGITIYAWMTDIKMAGLTLRSITGLTAQGPTEQDEQANGRLSKIASRVAGMASAVAVTVPEIAPYALATEAAAVGASRLLRLFGYSRPLDDGGTRLLTQQPVGNMVNTNVGETAIKLALDSRQEITIDPRVSGAGSEDHMSISSIVSREAFYVAFPWSISDTNEDLLFRCAIDPCIFRSVLNSGNTAIYDGPTTNIMPSRILTPMGQVASMFKHWKGDLLYRFQVVASGFHKGRLRLVYDPCNSDGTNDYNVSYSKIIDISTERDTTVSIGVSQPFTWLTHLDPTDSGRDEDDCFSIGPPSTTLSANNVSPNGTLSVYVVNELTVPNSATPSTVSINVFASGNTNFRVANPINVEGYYNFEPQGPSTGDENKTGQDDHPIHTSVVSHLGLHQPDGGPAERMFMGESVPSVNILLKRYNHMRSTRLTGVDDTFQVSHGIYPIYPGMMGNILPDTLTGIAPGFAPGRSFISARHTAFSIMAPCYLGSSGSTRWKYLAAPLADSDSNDIVMVSRLPNGTSYVERQFNNGALNSANLTSEFAENSMFNMVEGGHIVTANQVPSLEIELPFYRNVRFNLNRTLGNATSESGLGARVTMYSNTTSSNKQLHMFVATGDDFRFHFWMSTPFFIPAPRDGGILYPIFL